MNLREQYELHRDLVYRKETSIPGLFVLKYKNRVFYEDLWDEFLRTCRGLIVDADFNVITLPFHKIHNFRVEADAPQWEDDVEVDVVRKVNGFLCALSVYDGQLIVSTTGSVDSDFAKLARAHVSKELEEFILTSDSIDPVGHTFMFECCNPLDPHIVEEESGLYFLGLRENTLGSKVFYNPQHEVWNNMGVKTLPVEQKTVGEVMAELKTCQHEGFVMYRETGDWLAGTDSQESKKCKSPYYLTKKMFMRGNLDKLFSRDPKSKIDEEYYPLCDWVEANKEELNSMPEQERRVKIEQFLIGNV